MTEADIAAVAGRDCEQCQAPIFGHADLTIDLSRIAYWAWMRMPTWLAFSRLGFAILPWAGIHAYSCACYPRNRVARAHLQGQATTPNDSPAKGGDEGRICADPT